MSELPEIQKMTYTDDSGEEYEFFIETKPVKLDLEDEDGRPGRGGGSKIQMQQATRMIRGYAAYAVSAFKKFSAAKVEEVNLAFGLKIGGKVGIPYITEGSTESNLSIQVKCTFPDNETEYQRAERLAERLRALGEDPDSL
ncbi:MAG: CU044_2847 family protein [Prochloraceae cyanobacterium]